MTCVELEGSRTAAEMSFILKAPEEVKCFQGSRQAIAFDTP